MKKLLARVLLLVFLALWVAILWTATVYKLIKDGFASYFRFFTNWNWTIQVVFFTLELLANAVMSRGLSIFNLTILFWVVNGTTWLVFWLVFVMIKDNANILLSLMVVAGGPYQNWVVLEAHAVFHVLISISLLVYIIFKKRDIDDSVYPVVYIKRRRKKPPPRQSAAGKAKKKKKAFKLIHHSEEVTRARHQHGSHLKQHLYTDPEGERLRRHNDSPYDSDSSDDEGGMHWGFRPFPCPSCCHSAISVPFLLYVFIAPASVIGLYSILYDLNAIYGITTHIALMLLYGAIILLVFNVSYVLILMLYFRKPRTYIYKGAEKTLVFVVIRFLFCVPTAD